MDAAYVSIFKIDGKPILPPLMTEAVRMEMRQYRMQAVKLEERLRYMRELTNNLDSTQELPDTQGYVTCKSFVSSESTSDLVTELEVTNGKESPLFIPSMQEKNTSKESNDLAIEELASNLSISERSVPEVSVPGSPPEREEKNDVPLARLVRSNSYTLEAPSPHLADLLTSGKHSPIPTVSRATVDLRKVKSKVDSRLKRVPSKAGIKKALTSPYAQIYKCPRNKAFEKIKALQVPKTPVKKPEEVKSPVEADKKPPEMATPQNLTPKAPVKTPEKIKSPEVKKKPQEMVIPQNQNEISQFLNKIEAEHKIRMQELLDMQVEEQRKFRETFSEQQKLLVESLRKSFPDISLSEDANGNESLPSTPPPDRRSKPRENSLDRVTQIYLKQHLTQVRQESDAVSPRSVRAASVINAHVRGYLVRRLLRTETVQQIIQTFHDTCVFLSELHRDAQNKNSTDVELKRRLLQQLRSSLGSLHGVFFQMPVKERMEIIAKDRDSIRQRLQRATQRRAADSRKGHQMNKLKIVAL